MEMEITRRLDINSLVHLNNFIFLVFAFCTDKVYSDNFKCKDQDAEGFLYFILYGNLIVYNDEPYIQIVTESSSLSKHSTLSIYWIPVLAKWELSVLLLIL